MTPPIPRRASNTGPTPTRRCFKKAWTHGGWTPMSRRPKAREDNILTTNKLFLGSGARYANIYPLFHSGGVSDGQRAASRQKRVFILSRSAYAGSQRYGVTAWSGDVLSDWLTFQRQIPAGLNYAISGMPYWTTDIGGFISGGNLNDPKFRELFVRWFQFGSVLAHLPCAWDAQSQRERVVVLRAGGAEDPGRLRHAPLPADALHLFRGMAGDQQSRHADAPAGDGLARTMWRRRIPATSICSGRRFW